MFLSRNVMAMLQETKMHAWTNVMMGSMLSRMTLKQTTYALIAPRLMYPQIRSLALIHALTK